MRYRYSGGTLVLVTRRKNNMGLFYNYNKTGSGVDKNAPQKSRIVLFFEILLRHFWKITEVNLLYSVFILPAFFAVFSFFIVSNITMKLIISGLCTIVFFAVFGPATTAVFKVMKNYSMERHVFIIRDFKKGFTESYKKSLAAGIINIFVYFSVFSAIYIYPKMAEAVGSNFIYVMMVLSISLGVAVTLIGFYVYLMIAVTDIPFKDIIRNSIILTIYEIKKNLLTLLFVLLIAGLFVLMALVNLYTMVIYLVVPAAVIMFIISFNCYPVLKKYVIDPYYEKIGEKNPDDDDFDDEEAVFTDMGGKEEPIDNRKKNKKGRTVS